MEEEPLSHLVDIKTEPFVLNDKCAEVYRNNNLGTYSFLCFACGVSLDSSAADSIFKHLDTHYSFEGHDSFQGKQEPVTLEELIYPIVPIQTVFLDVNKPTIENNTSTKIEIIDIFNCDICKNTYTTKSDLIVHLQEHTTRLTENIVQTTNINSANSNDEGDPDIYNCDQCDKKYSAIFSLRRHRNNKHPELYPISLKKKCEECGTVFKNETFFKNHNCAGVKEMTAVHECVQCDKKYPSITSIRRHYKKKHPELRYTKLKPLNCDQCGEKYSFKLELRNHRKEKHPETINPGHYQCDKCFQVMKNRASFKAHYAVHSENRFKCKECDKMLNCNRSLNAHYIAHYKSRFKCEECGIVFKNETLLKDHNCVGLKERKMHECGLCVKKYLSKYALTLHGQKKHKFPLPSYECDICNETFNNIRNFAQHRRTHSSTFQFKCNMCDKVFKNRTHLSIHKTIHDPTTIKHVCDICDKKFRTPQNLKTHIRTHTGEKPYECTICQRKLITSTELKAHIMRAHTFEKKFQCELCGKHFYTRSSLKIHMRYHNNDRPHKCQFCDEKFHSTGRRQEHERKHTGERPYNCKVCEYSCRTSRGLKQHAILHTGAKPYSCRFCDMKFAQGAGRRGHERNRHGCARTIKNS